MIPTAALFLVSLVAAQQCNQVTVRKEVNDMTAQEWQTYQSTLRQAAATPDSDMPHLSIWEAAASFHNQKNNEIHWTCSFFWWHRMFITQVERKLQKINPDFFFPYWDSASMSENPMASSHWKYIGTTGTPLQGDVFKGQALQTDTNRSLYRSFTGGSITLPQTAIYDSIFQDSLKLGGFKQWAKDMEIKHGYLHNSVGGQMSGMYSPVDPLFYMHHGHLDSMWAQAQVGWKNAGLTSSSQVGGNLANGAVCTLNSRLPGYSNVFNDVLDISTLCVRYSSVGEKIANNTNTSSTRTHITTSIQLPTGTSVSASTSATATSTSIKCLPPLPQSCVDMQDDGSAVNDIDETQDRLQAMCQTVSSNAKKGILPPPMPNLSTKPLSPNLSTTSTTSSASKAVLIGFIGVFTILSL